MADNPAVALEFKNITKTFGHVVANNNVTLDVRKGEVLSILGENGCGKTTLMNMAAGIYFPDHGSILIDGHPVTIRSPKDAYEHKIGMIHQHFKLVDIFTAAENIVLGLNEEGKYNIANVNARVSEIASRYGFNIDPKAKIYDMSVSEKQTVEIIKVLYRGADILILDEPTAVLTLQEIKRLFEVLRHMAADGKSVVIITHKLNEVMEVSDRVAVMRKGEHIATVDTDKTTIQQLTDMMVGYKTDLNIHRSEPVSPRPRIEVKHLSLRDKEGNQVLSNVSFKANGGEILGIAGIAGSGQRELLETIAGILRPEKGEIIFHNPKKDRPVTFYHKTLRQIKKLARERCFHYPDGSTVTFAGKSNRQIRDEVRREQVLFNGDEIMDLRYKTPLEIRNLGVKLSFVPEDRLGMGLVGNMGISDNMMLRSYRKGMPVFLNLVKPKKLGQEIVDKLEVVTPSLRAPVRRLSGGNLQKVLVGREISSSPKVLMAAYPVRGLDINSSYLIYELLDEQKRTGTAVIFVGEDLDVLMELCDRIIVMNSGSITGTVDGRTVTKDKLGFLMTKQVKKKQA
ncbi:MAG: ATP-binding cassette domain-containing protein [Clostridia bacterium]|nr:ATP-binding cassette domain-containing protein [Clostridia bacterium]